MHFDFFSFGIGLAGGCVGTLSLIAWLRYDKVSHRMSTSGKLVVFSGFKTGRKGNLIVDRQKLHESDGYKRQVEALKTLAEVREDRKGRG